MCIFAAFFPSFRKFDQGTHICFISLLFIHNHMGAQWLSGRVLDWRPRGRWLEPHRRHCVVSLSTNIKPSLVLVQPRKTRPFITERLLMGCEESNQTNKTFTINFWDGWCEKTMPNNEINMHLFLKHSDVILGKSLWITIKLQKKNSTLNKCFFKYGICL